MLRISSLGHRPHRNSYLAAPDFRRACPDRDQQPDGYQLSKKTIRTRIQALRRACPGRTRRRIWQGIPMEPIHSAYSHLR